MPKKLYNWTQLSNVPRSICYGSWSLSVSFCRAAGRVRPGACRGPNVLVGGRISRQVGHQAGGEWFEVSAGDSRRRGSDGWPGDGHREFWPCHSHAGDLRVDLVAAVHIADKGYYQELNKRFAGYDAVLYELVAPEGTRIPKGGRKDKSSGNMLSAVQVGMKDLLKLEFQLDQVDYTRKNLVHADLSPEQFVKSMRKEGFTDIFTRWLAYALAKQAQGGDGGEMQLLMAMFDKNRSLALKRAMADQFEEMEGMTAALEGPKGSTLIGERNKRALEVLKSQLAAGKKKIAIFYGAGHMADMEKHLRADFAIKPQDTQWLQAWDMK